MIKAVLFALDNTLLHGDEGTFTGEYLRLADAYFADVWHMTSTARLLEDINRALAAPRDAQATNSGLAAGLLAAAAGHSPQTVREALDVFFDTRFPALRDCFQPAAGAADALALAREQGLAVVIATNALYPAAAVRQQLAWAGLPADSETYALVTTGDNMHFARPDPAYYAEIVARVGVEPDEALIVGSSLTHDIQPAAQARLRTYHVNGRDTTSADAAGSLADFTRQMAADGWLDTLPPRPLKPEAVEPQLWGNVGALFGMLTDVQPAYWEQHPDPNEWSILQIVCHLLESEDQVQRPRLQRILREDNPFLVNPVPPPGPHMPPCSSDGVEAARQFAARRRETLALLRALPAAAWGRPARHSVFGPTTLLEMALFTAQHDRLHLNQLCRTLGRCE